MFGRLVAKLLASVISISWFSEEKVIYCRLSFLGTLLSIYLAKEILSTDLQVLLASIVLVRSGTEIAENFPPANYNRADLQVL